MKAILPIILFSIILLSSCKGRTPKPVNKVAKEIAEEAAHKIRANKFIDDLWNGGKVLAERVLETTLKEVTEPELEISYNEKPMTIFNGGERITLSLKNPHTYGITLIVWFAPDVKKEIYIPGKSIERVTANWKNIIAYRKKTDMAFGIIKWKKVEYTVVVTLT